MTPKKRAKPRRRIRGRRRRKTNPLYVVFAAALALAAGGAGLLAARPRPSDAGESLQFPAWIQSRGQKVRQAYTQAVAHQVELQHIPCYCGCGGVGHKAVVDCHIANIADDGSITYDQHSVA